MSTPTPPTLTTERLLLRPLRMDDLKALNAIQSDPDHMRFYPHPPARARQGIATEAAACRDWVFATLEVAHVISPILPENLASRGVAENLGMRMWKDVMWGTAMPRVHHVYRSDRLDPER